MKIYDVLKYSKEELKSSKIKDSDIISKIAIEHFFKISKNDLIIHLDDEINDSDFLEFKNIINKIKAGVPIQYITNKQEFMNVSLYVDGNVLIPQPDTEVLVEEVINKYMKSNCKILDLCTGSGAIGISLAKNIPNSEVYLSDISIDALKVAKMNCQNNNVESKVHIVESNMFDEINETQFDCIVSNPPYIKNSVIENLDMQVKNEPHIALDGGEDGLKFYRIIAQNAWKYLKNGGKIYLEIGYDQKEQVTDILNDSGYYTEIFSIKDYGQNDRVIVATRR